MLRDAATDLAWPDRDRLGMPLRSDQDGNHILTLNNRPGEQEVAKWLADTQEWLLPGATLPKSRDWAAKFAGYVSPVRSNADLRAAYQRGMETAQADAADRIAQAEDIAVQRARERYAGDLAAARREGAEQMRLLAADVAVVTDEARPADHLGTFYEGNALSKWHRRLFAAAIQDLPLPGDQSQG